MRSKALYVIPVAALALCAFATPKFVAPIEETVTNLEGKGTEKSLNLQVLEQEKKPVALKDKAQSPAGKFTSEEVKEQDIDAQPLIVLNGKIFEIPKDAAKDINSEEQLTKLLNIDPEDVESISVLQKDAATAKWGDKGANGAILINTKSKDDIKDLVKKLPGAEMDDDGNITVGGKSVAKIILNDKEVFNKNDTIYNVPAMRAQYPGGDPKIFKFIYENVRYPKLCHEFGVQGRVLVTFVIEKDGSISNIEKSRAPSQALTDVTVQAYKKEHPDSKEQLEPGQDLGELLFEEAKRVVELMPKWEPAKDEDGNVVRSRFTLPFIFRLN
jgi:TonB-dependent SusC/RagA subfamily outer membrane receptor